MVNPKIMIVDDDEDLHTLYGLYLQSESYQVVRAYNGEQALELVEVEKPDLIVLDMIMPVMDGETFFTKLRTEKKHLNIPVIIASVNDKIPPKLFELGNVYTNLKKPFTIESLIHSIKEALEKSQGA